VPHFDSDAHRQHDRDVVGLLDAGRVIALRLTVLVDVDHKEGGEAAIVATVRGLTPDEVAAAYMAGLADFARQQAEAARCPVPEWNAATRQVRRGSTALVLGRAPHRPTRHLGLPDTTAQARALIGRMASNAYRLGYAGHGGLMRANRCLVDAWDPVLLCALYG
jgi:hypothetical protein